jgi:hypothetical protein
LEHVAVQVPSRYCMVEASIQSFGEARTHTWNWAQVVWVQFQEGQEIEGCWWPQMCGRQ